MRMSTLVRMTRASLSDPRVVFGRKRHLFLLSHMRSYSSLLAHIMGSHPQITGHSERLRSYRRRRDLIKARYEDYLSTGDGSYRYFLDKVLHNEYAISDDVVRLAEMRAIVFLREPSTALPSIIRMGREMLADENYADHRQVVDYYIGRLQALARSCDAMRTTPLYFDARDIIEKSSAVLQRITSWLDLEPPLSTEYTVFADTGETYRGDPSANLKRGRIVSPAESPPDDSNIASDLLAQAHQCYLDCRRRLLNSCETID